MRIFETSSGVLNVGSNRGSIQNMKEGNEKNGREEGEKRIEGQTVEG